jgi:hypothetical protein
MNYKLVMLYFYLTCNLSAMPRPQPMDEGEGPQTFLGTIITLVLSWGAIILIGHFMGEGQRKGNFNYLGCTVSVGLILAVFIFAVRNCSL